MFWIFDWQSQKVLYVSPAFEAIWGLSGAALLKDYDIWGQSIHPDDLEYANASFQRIITTGGGESREYRIVRPDGAVRWVSDRGFAVYNADGSVHRLVGIAEDITKRKQAEAVLREEMDKAQNYLDIAGVIITAIDTQGDVTLINRRGSDILGYLQDEILGKNWFDNFIPRAIRTEVRDVFTSLMAGEIDPVEYFENPVLTRSGQERLIAWHNTLLKNDNGKIIGSLSSGEDITERQQSEQERERLLGRIRAQARQMEQILATVPEGVLLLNSEGRILQANPVAEDLLKVLAGVCVGEILTHLGDRRLPELLTSPPTKGLWHEVHVEDHTYEIIARPMENGVASEYWVIVIDDVTREREIQAQLQGQERMAAVGQLAAGIAHDFNNILAVIVLYTHIGLQHRNLPRKLSDHLEIIDQQARRAADLIQQILDFSRRAVLERRPVKLAPFFKRYGEIVSAHLA